MGWSLYVCIRNPHTPCLCIFYICRWPLSGVILDAVVSVHGMCMCVYGVRVAYESVLAARIAFTEVVRPRPIFSLSRAHLAHVRRHICNTFMYIISRFHCRHTFLDVFSRWEIFESTPLFWTHQQPANSPTARSICDLKSIPRYS